MSSNSLPQELEDFIARFIHSVEQLEILCLLMEHHEKPWIEGEVFQRIQSSMNSIQRTLRSFKEAGFLIAESENGYRYAPQNPRLSALAAELAETYRQRRVTVVETIYKAPRESIRDFSEAFRLRKDK